MNKNSRLAQKVDIARISLYKDPSAQGLEKDAFFFAVENQDSILFLRSGRTFGAQKVKSLIRGEEFLNQFSEDDSMSKFSPYAGKSKFYYSQSLPIILDCNHFTGSLHPRALAFLRRTLTDRTYSLKKLLEIEAEFVLEQVLIQKAQYEASKENFDFSALEL